MMENLQSSNTYIRGVELPGSYSSTLCKVEKRKQLVLFGFSSQCSLRHFYILNITWKALHISKLEILD